MSRVREHIEQVAKAAEEAHAEFNRKMLEIGPEQFAIEKIAAKAFLDGGAPVDEFIDTEIRKYQPRIRKDSKNYNKQIAEWKQANIDRIYIKTEEEKVEAVAKKAGMVWYRITSSSNPFVNESQQKQFLDEVLEKGGFEEMMERYLDGTPLEDIVGKPDGFDIYYQVPKEHLKKIEQEEIGLVA